MSEYLPSVKVSIDEQSTPNIATTSPAATDSTSYARYKKEAADKKGAKCMQK